MTIDQLQYVRSLARTRSFTATAEALNVAQSTVSKQLQALEAEWGLTLFDRNNRNVRLSPAGERLYPEIEALLDRLEGLGREARRLSGAGDGALEIAALPIMGHYGLLGALERFEGICPGRKVRFLELEEPELLDRLGEGAYDVVIAREEILPPSAPPCALVATDRLALFVPMGHPLAGEESVSPERLRGERFMFMPEHTYVYSLCMALCREAGFQPEVLRLARAETILRAVEAGQCVTLLMSGARAVFRSDRISVVPVEPPVTSRVVLVVNGRRVDDATRRALVDCFSL